jgi:hypothetical protein
MEPKIIKNWGIEVNFTNLMTGAKRTEYWERVESDKITPLYMSPDKHFYTIGIIGLTIVDQFINQQ